MKDKALEIIRQGLDDLQIKLGVLRARDELMEDPSPVRQQALEQLMTRVFGKYE